MKKKSNKINFKSNSSRAIYNYVLESNYKSLSNKLVTSLP